MKGISMKVLHCPIVALYQPYLYVKGLRELTQRIASQKSRTAWARRAVSAAYFLVIGGAVYQVLIVSLPLYLQAHG